MPRDTPAGLIKNSLQLFQLGRLNGGMIYLKGLSPPLELLKAIGTDIKTYSQDDQLVKALRYDILPHVRT